MDTSALINLIIQLVSGAAGGNIVGSLAKNINLGTLWNSVVGALGGGLGGQILSVLGVGGAAAAGAAGAADGGAAGLDAMAIIQSVLGGGAGGGVLMAIVGMIKKAMAGNVPRT
jgi:hypothetical protein